VSLKKGHISFISRSDDSHAISEYVCSRLHLELIKKLVIGAASHGSTSHVQGAALYIRSKLRKSRACTSR